MRIKELLKKFKKIKTMRKLILKSLSAVSMAAAIVLISIYIIAPFFEEKEDLNPKVAEEQTIEEDSEQENDTI